MSTAVRWTCGDLFCGANVVKVVNVEPRDTESGVVLQKETDG